MHSTATENGSSAAADDVRRVSMTSKDRDAGEYSVQALQLALEGLHQDGVVILKDLVDSEFCDNLYDHMTETRDHVLETRHKGESTYNQGVKCMDMFILLLVHPRQRLTEKSSKHLAESTIHQARTST